MQPVFDERLARCAFALGDFVFVMRKFQIFAAEVQVKGFTGREVRYLLLTAHYRETFNFTLDGLTGAKTALGRIDECVSKLHELSKDEQTQAAPAKPAVLVQFENALADDLNISAAWAAVFDWVRETNKRVAESQITPQEAALLVVTWQKINSVLGLHSRQEINLSEQLDEQLQILLDERTAAKKAKDFKRSDAIRDQLKAKGWVIEDTPKGIKLKKI